MALGGRVKLVEEEESESEGESSRSEKGRRQLAGVYQDRRSRVVGFVRICSRDHEKNDLLFSELFRIVLARIAFPLFTIFHFS